MTAQPLVADTTAPAAADPLAPVRAALLQQAGRAAAVVRTAADEDAGRLVAAARAEAEQILARARAAGERDAQRLRAEERARARRRARGIVLAAHRAALDDFTRRAGNALRAEWDDPAGRATLRAALVARAQSDLGPAAVVSDHPAGGIVATDRDRRAVYRLDDLATHAVSALVSRLDGSWSG